MIRSGTDWTENDRRTFSFGDIEQHLDGVRCVGFDVFDTLLLRMFMRPTDLFSYVEEKESAPGFRRERISAEKRARMRIHKETDIDGIYSVIDEKYRHLKDREIETELRYCFADPCMKEIYDRIVGLGIDAVMISDMYLPKECIAGMLEKNGYSGYKKIYVSNEHGTNKHSGGLFNIVLRDLGLRPDEMLFIGDDPHSDSRMPMKLGIRSVRFTSARDRYAASHRKEMRILRKGCAESSVIVSLDMLRWLRSPFDDYWHEIAYRFGGPVSSFFMQFMILNMNKNVGTILFIARDGYNLQKIYNILSDGPLNNHYVYASRQFAMIFGNSASNKDRPRCILEHFSGSKEIRELGIPDNPSDKDVAAFVNDNQKEFGELLDAERLRYSEYIRNKVGNDGDVLVVDATTKRFSSQRLIEGALGNERRVTGCYYNLLARSDTENIAYADRSNGIINWTKVNVPEFFLGSPEAPVTDMTADGTPIFQKEIHEQERFRMSIYDRITKGEIEYANDLKAIFGDDIPSIGYKVVDRWMKALVRTRHPGKEHISEIQWAPDTMHTRYRGLVFGPKDLLYKMANMLGDLKWRIRSR